MNQEALSYLHDHIPALSERDQDFAASLIRQHRGFKGLSAKQWVWVEKLADRARNGYPEPQKAQVGNFQGVIALLAKAGERLKHPRIVLRTPGGLRVALGVAGPRSRCPGTVNVTDGGPFGSNLWFGRIERDGTWSQSHRDGLTDEARQEVFALLCRLAEDPAGTAAEYGKTTGHCCFCRKGLEDERSTSVGYGPVCAKNFGLPWGANTPKLRTAA